MNPEQQKSILAIALFAAFADGARHDREREEIRRIAESLGDGVGAPDATTCALGQLAKRYYSGGRVMSTAMLKDSFQNLWRLCCTAPSTAWVGRPSRWW